jgi:hypothetical protein
MPNKRKELNIIFDALHDGLRQETRRFVLAQILAGEKEMICIAEEREAHLQYFAAQCLREAGYWVQVGSYFYSEEKPNKCPDLAVWLPKAKEYLFLEVKVVAPNYGYSAALKDIEKRSHVKGLWNKRNGLIAIGFKKAKETIREDFEEKV